MRSGGTVGKRGCNADCRDVSVFNIKVINNTKGRARPAAVKGRGGVGKTEISYFFPSFLLRRGLPQRRVVNCGSRWGIYAPLQMEVTSDLSCGAGRRWNCQTMDCLPQ